MKTWSNRLLVGVSLLLLECGGSVGPRSAPASNTARSRQSEVVLLGTGHDLSQTPSFSPQVMVSIFEAFHPSILLLELPIDWFDGDSPAPNTRRILEKGTTSAMNIAWAYCRRTGVRCLPFDVRGRNDFYRETRFLDREDAFWDAFLQEAKARTPLPYEAVRRLATLKRSCSRAAPEVLCSTICDAVVENEHGYRDELARNLLSMGWAYSDAAFFELSTKEWNDRNRAMASNICDVGRNNAGARVIVTVGHEHRYALRRFLEENCRDVRLRELPDRP